MGTLAFAVLIPIAVAVALFVRHAVRNWGAGAQNPAIADGGIGSYITQLRTGHHRRRVADGGDSGFVYDAGGSGGSHDACGPGDAGCGDGGGGGGE